MGQQYRFNLKLRRRGQPALDSNRVEFKSEDYDDDMQFCMAIASEAYEILQDDRDYLANQEGDDSDE